ncbi:MAG: PorP/SprF family type IX secretion system membrane protein [Bacteroidota bacterium]
MKRFYLLFCAIGFLFLHEAKAQQTPQYTQYMYNMNVVNPAYAGSKESLSVGMLYRDQWSGIDGAPRTFTFTAHSPLGNGLGIGVSAINDRIGPVEQSSAVADISYTLELGQTWNLAFGAKAGASFHDIGLANVDTQIDLDPAFSGNYNETYGVFGAGVFLYSDKFYVGLSVPNFLDQTHFEEDSGRAFGREDRHFFGTMGYVFDLTDDIKFKPSTFVKTQLSDFDGSFISYDINANFLFYERFEIGASYRVDDSFSALVGVKPFDWMHIGFAYDATTSDLNKPSYEAFMIFDIFFKKKTYLSPRYF